MRVVKEQEFTVYADDDPSVVSNAIKARLTTTSWFVKQMGILQYTTKIAAWVLRERESVQ